MNSLVIRDQEHIWHPYTQHREQRPLLAVRGAKGVFLEDESGRPYIDAISSWWTNLHGHSHPYIAAKIHEQALQLDHVLFAGCTHEPAVRLAERLLSGMPGRFSKVFYSDNGSTAVEVGLKMAIQFRKNKDDLKRKKILALRHSYHGDTFGAMSVSERSVFTLPFGPYLFPVEFLDTPGSADTDAFVFPDEEDLADIACFIYEPLLQGAGGMRMYPAEWLDKLIGYLQARGVTCIADEVMTGFGRTGKLFASDYLHNKPDIICLSKGLTGGALPLAATICTAEIYDAFLSDDLHKTFFHGHSYTANPIACAAALASLDLLEDPSCMERIGLITESNRKAVEWMQQEGKWQQVRSLGTVLAFELDSADHFYLNKIREETMSMALAAGVFLRPLGNTVYIMPPYCINGDQLGSVYEVLFRTAPEFLK